MSGAGGAAAQAADLVAVLRSYVDTMLLEAPGTKVLLLDGVHRVQPERDA